MNETRVGEIRNTKICLVRLFEIGKFSSYHACTLRELDDVCCDPIDVQLMFNITKRHVYIKENSIIAGNEGQPIND